MGVTGLWRLIEPAGKPVPVETLENKVLAVDISIWLHQMVKGYQDAKGAPVANAHLMGLFQRLCKLLYFRIKPVFVFDGAFPELKRETIAKRQDNKAKYNSESERLKRELALLLTKKTAISSLLGKQISPKKASAGPAQNDDDIFKLPALPQKDETESESEDEESSSSSTIDLHSVDVESDNFKNLPPKEKYDLLVELKETRKMNSWGRLHELPKKSDNFSDFQMQRLLKRRKIQECLEETEKEMGDGGMSLNELESLLNEEGIDTKIESLPTKRIASNNTTRFLLINDVKQALAEAKKKKDEETASCSKTDDVADEEKAKKDELEEDLEKAIKMSLECGNEADTSAYSSKADDSWTSYYSDFEYSSDSEENDGAEVPDMSSAKAYIMQYCDFTVEAIDKIVSKKDKSKKIKKPVLNEIIEEINNEKSVIVDRVDLSSDEDDKIVHASNNSENKTDNNKVNEEDSILGKGDLEVTQASVLFVDDEEQDVIKLDSSTEEILETSQGNDKVTPPKPSKEVSEDDSSDNDFEDVPEVETKLKTVVQLTLTNTSNALEDDIFADIFENKKEEKNKTTLLIKQEKHEIEKPKINEIIQIDEDEELQKAIQMSLECVADNNTDHIVGTKEIPSQSDNSPDVRDIPKRNPGPRIANSTEGNQSKDNVTKPIEVEVTSKEPNKSPPQKESISVEKLTDMVEEINTEEQGLLQEKGRLDRVGRNITEQMTKDAQELLQLFGIPYIVAPMEAEAQCAFLESVKLTDGTITDDSDIWLFGGRTVYKNFFNQKKHVLQFLADKIEKSFNLNREQLVLLALLVGSDYTTGVAGVGPVTALEILASFPFNKRNLNEATKQERYVQMIAGLQEFKQWVKSGRRTDNLSLKRKLRNVNLNEDFPSVRVVQAYLEPNIEKSEERFTWGEIDVTILREYTKAKFGWSQHKLDEIVKPVLKRLTERKSQKSVQDYFKRKVEYSDLEHQMSKRVKAAVQKMGPEGAIESNAIEEDKTQPERKKKGKSKTAKEAGPSKAKQTKTEENVLTEQSVKVVSEIKDGVSVLDIKINKTDRYQEIIPQREKDKQSLLQNKMKAIETFRKTNIDKKKKLTKRKAIVPKADAGLSESSDSD